MFTHGRKLLSGILAAVLVAGSSSLLPAPAHALSNGLALTPPMGWNSWNAFRCDINEQKIRSMADAMVSSGLRDAGYTYLNIDDCWQAPTRDKRGRLRPHPQRFPSGMKSLVDYIHSKGLKAGIYGTPGTKTCANIWDDYPGQSGSLGHETQDARTFAEWGFDYLKYDWCQADRDGLEQEASFRKMSNALRATGRPMVYSIHSEPQLPVEKWRPEVANMWRTTGDIQDNWYSMIFIGLITLIGQRYQGPGSWNDPDMLEIGNSGMTTTEYTTHMTLWSILGAPLIMGHDLRKQTPDSIRILTNKTALSVDQDALGAPAQLVGVRGGHVIIAKRLTGHRIALAVVNLTLLPQRVSVSVRDLTSYGLPEASTYRVREAWTGQQRSSTETVTASLPGHGSALFVVGK